MIVVLSGNEGIAGNMLSTSHTVVYARTVRGFP